MDVIGWTVVGIALLALAIRLVMAGVKGSKAAAIAAAEAKRVGAEEMEAAWQSWRNTVASETIAAPSLREWGDYLVRSARHWAPGDVAAAAWTVYQDVLSRLKTQPELKPLALDFGRVAYAARRSGSLIIYDEQAIQNDLIAHGSA